MPGAPTYRQYREWGLAGDEASFSASLQPAMAVVARIVGPNPVDTDERLEAWQRAVCAACESVSATGTVAAGSVSLGSFSMSGPSDGSGWRDAAAAAALDWLVPAGLAFGGAA